MLRLLHMELNLTSNHHAKIVSIDNYIFQNTKQINMFKMNLKTFWLVF